MNTSESQTTESTPADVQDTAVPKSSAPAKPKRWPIVLVAALAVGGIGASAWVWQQSQAEAERLAEKLEALQLTLAQEASTISQTRQEVSTGDRILQQALSDQKDELKGLGLQVANQNKRLNALSTTTRDDWKLAEVEYLLRLANQRLVMSRETSGAEALLQTADQILRELDDIDLYPVRQAIAEEMAALRLAGNVDRQGLFLQLSALAKQLENLDTLDLSNLKVEVKDEPFVVLDRGTWWETLQASVKQALEKLESHIRFNSSSALVEPLMSPDEQRYLKINLRLMLEQAQLALLQEEPRVYQQSLLKAQEWVATYYKNNAKETQVVMERLNELATANIVQDLPDISLSIEQLRTYFEQLHQQEPIKKLAAEKAAKEKAAAAATNAAAAPAAQPEPQSTPDLDLDPVPEAVSEVQE